MAASNAKLSEAQTSVRTYLQWLQAPESLVDEAEVGRLRKQAAAAKDPLERLRIEAKVQKAQKVDVDALREGFYRYASQLASDESIPPEAFAAVGVSEDDLQRAGLTRQDGTAAPGKATAAKRRFRQRPTSPASEVTEVAAGAEDAAPVAGLANPARRSRTRAGASGKTNAGRKGVLQAIAKLDGEFFTISQVQKLSGASPITVRKTVEELISVGKVGEFEPDSEHATRGKPPRRYKTIAA